MQLTFDLETPGFSLTNARACAVAAKAAYANGELPSPPAPLPSDGRGWPDGGERGLANADTPTPHASAGVPFIRPSGTFSPSGGEGWDEGESAFIECKATNTQALVIDCGAAVIVAFRGTQEPLDFITDAEAWRRNITGCTVHFGFWKAMTSVFQPVCAAIRKISGNEGSFKCEVSSFKEGKGEAPPPAPASRGERDDPAAAQAGCPAAGKPLFITGHSLGGALAVLFAYRYAAVATLGGRLPLIPSFSPSGGEGGRRPDEGVARKIGYRCPAAQIYTFGQPRVGDRNFARLYNRFHGDQTFRVVNDQDLVPRVPGVLLGYRHCGSEALLPISNLKSQISNPMPNSAVLLNPPFRFKLLRDAWALWCARRAGPLALMALLRDHHMDQYLAKLGE